MTTKKKFEIKSTPNRSTTRWAIPTPVANALNALGEAIDAKPVEIIEALVSHTPGTDLTLYGKNGFAITLNTSIEDLTDEDCQMIRQARLGSLSKEEAEPEVEEKPAVRFEGEGESDLNEQAYPEQEAVSKGRGSDFFRSAKKDNENG